MWAIFQLIIEFRYNIASVFVFFFFFLPYRVACGILILPTGIEPPRPVAEGKVLTPGPLKKSQQSLLQFQFRVKRGATSFSEAETLKGKFVLIIPPPICFWLTLGRGKLGLVQMLVHQIRWGPGYLPCSHFKFTVF